jgi:hypothetical protein
VDEGIRLDLPHLVDPRKALDDDPELLALRRRDPIAYFDRIYGRVAEAGAAAFGFKLHYMDGYVRPRFVEHLASLPELRVLHLKRRDRLARYLSQELAKRTGTWVVSRAHGGSECGPADPSIELAPAACEEDFRSHAGFERVYDAVFSHAAPLELVYEDLSVDPTTSALRVQEFLGVVPTVLQPWTTRQSRRPLRDQIGNWSELVEHFASTPWRTFFESDA